MNWLEIVGFALLLVNLAVMPTFLFLLAVALAAIATAIAGRRPAPPRDDPASRFLIVIPAHNEEAGIAATVASCRSADYPRSLFGVAVIADNCSDQTAAVAAGAGARVVERSDAVKKSKGYAIEYLIARLVDSGEFDALEALVIVDADTTIDPGLLRHFDQDLRRGRDWIQCYYTVANPEESWRTRLLTYGFSLFNGVLLLGLNALGTGASLRGNGMGFSTRGLRRRPWASYGLVEDMEFSWTLRAAGEFVWFQGGARVYGAMVGSGGPAAANQRRRWEYGRSELRRKYLGPLLKSRHLGWWEKAVSVCELTLLPMGPLGLVYLLVAGLDVLAAAVAPAGPPGPILGGSLLGLAAVMTVALGTYAVSPFLALRLPWRYLRTLAFFPLYLGWKILVSFGGRPREWVRTTR